ncbi:hypothetical protein [Cytobacillus oceanisediminis]|uniref:hypothetical protein n=1 Tax=Cytobacillus oceanisediminis TaxID=665099 RepID=UPI00203F6554|nr:hypothetical protein [Cytobacillus oceanisediminis]MCM3394584.1 hypothetical protein [Cytobacillus oceanisediminis]
MNNDEKRNGQRKWKLIRVNNDEKRNGQRKWKLIRANNDEKAEFSTKLVVNQSE